jgi:hypothetical protein
MLEIEMVFLHSYEVEEAGEFPGTGKLRASQIFIPPPQGRPEHNGLWLKVKAANGRTWIGVFALGYLSSRTFSRVVSTPDLDRMCVIAQGAAYFVRADNPDDWEEIPLLPVTDVRAVPECNLLVLSDETSLAAYSRDGLVWRTGVCSDELRITSITDDTIECTGFDPMNSGTGRFVIDLKTGRSLLSAE